MWSALHVYPGGRVGAGLLLLRLGVTGSGLLLASLAYGLPSWRLAVALVLALLLCAGLGTRAAAAVGAVVMPLLTHEAAPVQNLILHAIGSAAVVLSGPGAFSIDCRLFGRRRILLRDPEDRPD